MNNNLKNYIEWTPYTEAPAKAGTYYVLGEGITGATPMKWDGEKWDKTDAQDPLVYGTLKSDRYSFIKTEAYKLTGLTSTQKKRAIIDDIHQITAMVGESKDDGSARKIVNAILYNDGTVKYFWNDIDDIKDDAVMCFFDAFSNALSSKVSKAKKKTESKPIETHPTVSKPNDATVTETFTNKPDSVEPTPETASDDISATPAKEEPEQSGTSTSEATSDDGAQWDDLPF